jgi:hypothetical protein
VTALASNPPWVSRVLRSNWNDLVAVVGVDAMPRPAMPGSVGDGFEPEEYGTGHYGTVMPTNTPGVVCKVTSDPAEAIFVACALSLGRFPDGIVHYERIVAVEESHKRRPVFVLWRQEANDVGFLADLPGQRPWQRGDGERTSRGSQDWELREAREAAALIDNTRTAAGLARDALKRSPGLYEKSKKLESWAYDLAGEHVDLMDKEAPFRWDRLQVVKSVANAISRQRGPHRVALALRFFEMGAEMMEHNSPTLTYVGRALDFYLENGLLLADVHLNNIGKIVVGMDDDVEEHVAITDPGHAVLLDERYASVSIPTAREARRAGKRTSRPT